MDNLQRWTGHYTSRPSDEFDNTGTWKERPGYFPKQSSFSITRVNRHCHSFKTINPWPSSLNNAFGDRDRTFLTLDSSGSDRLLILVVCHFASVFIMVFTGKLGIVYSIFYAPEESWQSPIFQCITPDQVHLMCLGAFVGPVCILIG